MELEPGSYVYYTQTTLESQLVHKWSSRQCLTFSRWGGGGDLD